jgi:DNA polymerase elongation subunit (family B)
MKDPKIVVFDLETLPNLRQALKVWPQLSNFPGLTLRATVSSIICFGYKQYTVDKKAKCVSAWDFPNWEIDVNDDSEVCKIAYEVLNDADAVVTHNGKRFDWRHLQTRLKANKLPLLPKIPHIDTKEIAKRHLYSFSNRLDYLGDWVVGGEKARSRRLGALGKGLGERSKSTGYNDKILQARRRSRRKTIC